MEEDYIQLTEQSDSDSDQEVLQIFTIPFELKHSENGKETACQRKRTPAFPIITAGLESFRIQS